MSLALEKHFLKRLFGILASVIAIYVVFLAVLVLFQRHLMYFPDGQDFQPGKLGLLGFTRMDYAAQDGTRLHGFYSPRTPGRRLTILFFQGNAGNLNMRADKIRRWQKEGYGVMLATYRGYAGNRGSPTEPGLYQDARAAIATLEAAGITRKDTVIYGESLGTGIGVQMASEGPCAALVLEAPYTSIPDVGGFRYPFVPIFWVMQDKFMSIAKIGNIHAPLLVLQAGRDYVVPPHFSRKLYDAANSPKQILVNGTAGHNTIYSSEDIVVAIMNFLGNIDRQRP